MTTTTNDFDNMTQDERWLGWGYLGERTRCDDPELIARNDAIVLERMAGWTYDEQFAWANSKLGRWVADGLFGGTDPAKVIAWGYIKKVAE